MWKLQVRYLTCADPENFLEGGGITFRPGWVQLHTSGVVINLSKWVDQGTDSYFWYIQKPEQDLMILINLSPQILGLLRLYFLLSREKVMVEPGTVSVRLGRLCDTALRTFCFFTWDRTWDSMLHVFIDLYVLCLSVCQEGKVIRSCFCIQDSF